MLASICDYRIIILLSSFLCKHNIGCFARFAFCAFLVEWIPFLDIEPQNVYDSSQ